MGGDDVPPGVVVEAGRPFLRVRLPRKAGAAADARVAEWMRLLCADASVTHLAVAGGGGGYVPNSVPLLDLPRALRHARLSGVAVSTATLLTAAPSLRTLSLSGVLLTALADPPPTVRFPLLRSLRVLTWNNVLGPDGQRTTRRADWDLPELEHLTLPPHPLASAVFSPASLASAPLLESLSLSSTTPAAFLAPLLARSAPLLRLAVTNVEDALLSQGEDAVAHADDSAGWRLMHGFPDGARLRVHELTLHCGAVLGAEDLLLLPFLGVDRASVRRVCVSVDAESWGRGMDEAALHKHLHARFPEADEISVSRVSVMTDGDWE
jgi:hypothetical protein